MSRILVVSPHFDDAIWSVGELMLDRIERGDRVVIYTPFGGEPPKSQPANHAKWDLLRKEHWDACMALGVTRVDNGTLLDDACGSLTQEQVTRGMYDNLTAHLMGQWAAPYLQWALPDEVWIPHGIVHPDHVMAHEAAFAIYKNFFPEVERLVYEELPYRVNYPAFMAGWKTLARRGKLEGYDPKHLPRKKELARMYASQLVRGEEDERGLWAPERLWRFHKKGE